MSDLARIRPLIVDWGCCSEIVHLLLSRLPVDARCVELSPHEANTLIVTGRITIALAPVLRDLYDRLGKPRRVIALGTCACSGEMLDTLPAAEVIPVDLALPGCPPSPEALADSLRTLWRRP